MNRVFSINGLGWTLAGSSALVLIALPVSAAAIGRPVMAANDTAAASAGNGFCSSLSKRATALDNRLSGLKNTVNAAWSTQTTKLATIESSVDKQVATIRATADKERQANFVKLEAKAKTPQEQSAVKTYESAVTAAVAAHRAAYDAARATFRSGLQSDIAARHNLFGSQVDGFVSAADSALSEAQSSCTTGGSSAAAVRTTLIANLKNARTTFVTERRSDNQISSQVQQLAASRDQAFKAADQTFKAALSSAATALKAAFGKDASHV